MLKFKVCGRKIRSKVFGEIYEKNDQGSALDFFGVAYSVCAGICGGSLCAERFVGTTTTECGVFRVAVDADNAAIAGVAVVTSIAVIAVVADVAGVATKVSGTGGGDACFDAANCGGK